MCAPCPTASNIGQYCGPKRSRSVAKSESADGGIDRHNFLKSEAKIAKKPQIPLMERGFKTAAREERDDQSELDL